MNDLPDLHFAENISSNLWHILRSVKNRQFSNIWQRREALKIMTEMRLDNHPSGYPDPKAVSRLTWLIRYEKFQLVREKGRDATEVAEIQSMIDVLKKMLSAAWEVRPHVVYKPTWREKLAYTSLGDVLVIILSGNVPLLQIIFAVSPFVILITSIGLIVFTLKVARWSYLALPTCISILFLLFYGLLEIGIICYHAPRQPLNTCISQYHQTKAVRTDYVR